MLPGEFCQRWLRTVTPNLRGKRSRRLCSDALLLACLAEKDLSPEQFETWLRELARDREHVTLARSARWALHAWLVAQRPAPSPQARERRSLHQRPSSSSERRPALHPGARLHLLPARLQLVAHQAAHCVIADPAALQDLVQILARGDLLSDPGELAHLLPEWVALLMAPRPGPLILQLDHHCLAERPGALRVRHGHPSTPGRIVRRPC